MPKMTSSQHLVHASRRPSKPVVVHHQSSTSRNRHDTNKVIGDFHAFEPAFEGLPLGVSVLMLASRDARCSDEEERPVITYGPAEPRRSYDTSLQDRWALQYDVPRPLQNVATERREKRSYVKIPKVNAKSESRRTRSPPPAPRPQRLSTPDLSDMECDTFCNCCKSTSENAEVVKVTSKKRSDTKVAKV